MPTLTFGEWIRAHMREKRLTGLVCSHRSGLTTSVWSRWARDQVRRKDGMPSQPRKETVEAIARALEVPYREALVAAGYTREEEPVVDEELISIYSSVPESKRVMVKQAFRSIVEAINVG